MNTDKTATKERISTALMALFMYWVTVQTVVSGIQQVPGAVARLLLGRG